jgi:hypothetical protein
LKTILIHEAVQWVAAYVSLAVISKIKQAVQDQILKVFSRPILHRRTVKKKRTEEESEGYLNYVLFIFIFFWYVFEFI